MGFRVWESLLIVTISIIVESKHNICEKLSQPYFGVINGSCDGSTPGGICNLTCDEGYTVGGPDARLCHSIVKKYIPPRPFHCLDRSIQCPPIRIPENGYLLGSCHASAGSVCHFTCRFGYRLTGSHLAVCSRASRKWTPPIPRCKPSRCPALPYYHHPGPWPKNCTREAGHRCEFKCARGYKVVGDESILCSSGGKWVGRVPSCALACSSVPIVPNGQLFGDCSPGLVGKNCYVLCSDGFRVTGSGFMKCEEDGNWDADFPTCERQICDDVDPPRNGTMTGQCAPGLYGKPCLFTCDYGFELSGFEAIHCKSNGKWSHETPICQRIVCPVVPTDNVAVFGGTCSPGVPEDWCNVTCVPGFASKASNAKCLVSGDWDPSLPNCTKRTHCPLPKAPHNGELTNCSTEIGSRCQQTCLPGFVAQGTPYRICLPSGDWDGTRLRCLNKNKFKRSGFLQRVQ